VEVNEELAYVVIEPGVTFEQLHTHLLKAGSRLVVSATGAPPDSSVIGNALERGVGRGPYGDRLDSMCNLEVVLPDGRTLETGYSRYPGAKSSKVARSAPGAYIDGLFTQSGLGIVTRMTVWLATRPTHLQTFFYKLNTEANLEQLVNALRELRLNGVLKTPMLLGNDYRFLSFGMQYPWNMTGGLTPLTGGALESVKSKANLGAWMGEGALHSMSVGHADADRRFIERTLGGLVDLMEFWDEERVKTESTSQLLPDPKMAWHSNPHRGYSIASSASVTYWRKPLPRPANDQMDPDRDNCGVMWLAPALPATGFDAQVVTRLYADVCASYGFEPNMGLLFATARCIYMTGALVYDRDIKGEDEKALVCYDELFSKMLEAGYPPYRVGIQSMRSLKTDSVYDDFIRQLKSTFDPHRIISPGRYEF
ncbi:MAG: FAD-binding oxidoreductase, partial [Bacteroidota bacterium]